MIAWWGVPTFWKILTKSAFEEFHAPLWDLSSRVDDLGNYWGHLSDSKQTLIEKAKAVSRIESDLELQTGRMKSMEAEISRLKSLKSSLVKLEAQLDLSSPQDFSPVVARVSHRSLSGWWQKLTIRKGRNHGLTKGLGVISDKGLLGRIKSVAYRSAEIELITNPSFRIVAHFQGDDRPVTFQGNGIAFGGQPYGLALDVPHDLEPKNGQPLSLVSSDLSGIFPRGMPIGKVLNLNGGEDGLFKSGSVTLNKQINQVYEVTILLPR